MLRQRLARPYEHVKHVSNFKSHGHSWRPCGQIFKFCKFRRKEKEIEPFDVISENRQPNGFFWSNKKKFVFPLLSADSRYFRIYALKGILKKEVWITATVVLMEVKVSIFMVEVDFVAFSRDKTFLLKRFFKFVD